MPVLHLLVGPNGSGRTTLWERVLGPATRLPFVNANQIARQRWPGRELEKAYEASRIAADERDRMLASGRSFASETVFSHPSKLDLVERAKAARYQVTLHVLLVPEDLAAARAKLRAAQGGHRVPEEKVRERFRRLWTLVAQGLAIADEGIVYDNARAATAFNVVARFLHGIAVGTVRWPGWSPLTTENGAPRAVPARSEA